MTGRFLKARFKCSLAHSEHNMRAACFDMMNKISLLTMCSRGTNRSRYASNVHLVLSFHLHVCLLVQPNYANKGEEDSLLQIMTLKGVYCSRQTVLALRRQGWPTTSIVDWVYERSIVLVHMDNMEKYGYDVDVDVVRQNLQEFFSYSDHHYIPVCCALVHYQLSWSSFATQYTSVNCRQLPLRDKDSKIWKWTIWLRRQR